jgi:hypothetical protein
MPKLMVVIAGTCPGRVDELVRVQAVLRVLRVQGA